MLRVLQQKGLSQQYVDHSEAVTDLSLIIAENIAKEKKSIDTKMLEAAALLHDIGVTTVGTSLEHAVIGAEIASGLGLPGSIARCIEVHAGVTRDEARTLGVPPKYCDRDYLPQSLEEKILFFSDLMLWTVCHERLDPWKDIEVTGRALYPYMAGEFKKSTGNQMPKDHPIFLRSVKLSKDFINYVSRNEVEEICTRYYRKYE